jgi:hypothetical protein
MEKYLEPKCYLIGKFQTTAKIKEVLEFRVMPALLCGDQTWKLENG